MLFVQTRLDLSHDVLLPLIRGRVDSALQMQLLPALGLQPIVQIRPAAVHMWFDDCSRTAPGGASRTLDILKQIFNYSIECGHIASNPARLLWRNPRL